MTTIIRAGTGPCELCGKTAELRPYGPRGEFICFACGMKDEATTVASFARTIQGEAVVLDARTPDANEVGVTTLTTKGQQ